MDITAPTTAAPSAPSSRRRMLANAAFVIFCLYVGAIYILALDQNLHWGLFPTRAERLLADKIQQLGDSSLPQAKRDDITKDIISWNTFSVPPLLKAIESGAPAVRDPAVKCLQTIAQKYYNVDISKYGSDPVQLRQWWNKMQADWAKAEKTETQS